MTENPSGWFLYRARDKTMAPIDGRYFPSIMGATLYGYEIKARSKRQERWGLRIGCTKDILDKLPRKED